MEGEDIRRVEKERNFLVSLKKEGVINASEYENISRIIAMFPDVEVVATNDKTHCKDVKGEGGFFMEKMSDIEVKLEVFQLKKGCGSI